MTLAPRCWCGNEQLEPFSEEYLRCPACESLVLTHWPEELFPQVDDEGAYYGKEYWFSHQEQDLGLPNIFTRARSDLTDRIPYWLDIVLRHRLPPGRVLELGCSHGGFAACLHQAGFDASGLELSRWVVDFARQTFHVPMYLGPIEQQDIEPGSLDLIIMMDVVEHLPDPASTLQHAFRALRPGGLMIIQTPAYPAGKSFNDLTLANDPFLRMLIPGDHLHLFSPQALKQLLGSLGMNFSLAEPALFPYDQFVFASSQPVAILPEDEITHSLQTESDRRIILAILDLHRENTHFEQLYRQADNDRVARLEQVNELGRQLSETKAADLAREEELTRKLSESDNDRAARLEIIQKLEKLYHQADADRIARLEQINKLGNQLSAEKTAYSDREEGLAYQLSLSEADRANRLNTIHKLEQQLKDRDTASILSSSQPKGIDHLLSALGLMRKPKALEMSPAEPYGIKAQPKLKRIIIDLTPVRPGGENGGMKLAAIELVKRFSRDVAPEVEYVLFTSSDTHAELAWLDAENVRRICVNQVASASPAVPPAPIPLIQANIPQPRRSPLRQIIHSLAQLLETILPPEVFRRLYQRYRQKVQAPQAQNLVRSLEADLVFCPFSAVFYHAPEIPTVVIIADLQFLYYPQFFTVEQNYQSDQNFRKVCQVASRLICLSDFTRKTVIVQGKVEPSLAVTGYPSLWNPLILPAKERVSQELSKRSLISGQYLFFPANFWPHKNHSMLLTAFNRFVRQHPESELKLVLAGAPNALMNALRLAVSRMGLEDRVVFAGYLNAEEVSAMLQGCLALIFPSLFEGFGAPVLEAMQFSKPVLCSQGTSLPEVGGDAAFYFDPRRPDDIVRAMERITCDDGLVQELAARGQNQALLFSDVCQWAQNYFKILEDVFEGKSVHYSVLNGMQSDGWASSYLEISIASDKKARQLELQLNVPPWFPKPKLCVRLQGTPLLEPKNIYIARGRTQTIQLPLDHQGGLVEIILKPTVIPKELGLNDDSRQLTCLVEICRIVSDDQSINLLHGFKP
jgi:glycosyltransferase involved in cell wall biosynthesis/2-polyprenyl-3-methyl-5-hydroxy-6-metoxy-1,4-benzoquinol methylase